MFDKIKKVMLYSGLDEASYQRYKAYILQHDMKNLRVYVLVTAAGFLLLGIASLFTGNISTLNTEIYMITAAAMAVLLLIQQLLMRSREAAHVPQALLIYLYMAIIYTEGILLAARHPELISVTYICAMLMLPLLFARPPVNTAILQCIFTCVFCIIVKLYKIPDIAFTDMWNGITFFLVSIAAIVVFVPMRVKSLVQTQIIRELSEFDLLTGVRNRNSYESECIRLGAAPGRLTVIYADANGLHELNNSLGHTAGDIMLKSVAQNIQHVFGRDYTYRIGGDEFIVVAPSEEINDIDKQLDGLQDIFRKLGYSVSFGYARTESDEETFDAVIRRAEKAMYEAKAEYYSSVGKDRRRR